MTRQTSENPGWFKKGTSGNLKGRPKGSKNQATLIEDVLNTVIAVTENGKKKLITKREAALIQLANKAASGDLRATKMLEDLYERHCKGNNAPLTSQVISGQEVPMTEEEVASRYYEVLKKSTSK